MWLDDLIGVFNPKAAYERQMWRHEYEDLKHYDAGSYGRSNAHWRVTNESAEMTDRSSRDVIRARARDLERNSDIMNSVISAFKRNIVGEGITLQAKTGKDKLNSQLEELWKEWCKPKNCDVTGQQNFNQLLRMMVERKRVDGGILIHKCYTSQGILPFQLQLLEVDELSGYWQSPHEAGNKVVGGIEYNSYNKPVGYWITKYSVDGLEQPVAEYYDAKDIIFYYSKKRPSQIREISDLAPSLTRVRDTNEFMTAVSVKERIAACLSVFIKKTNPSGGFGRSSSTATTAANSYSGKMLTPGMITELNAGDEIQVVDPKNNGVEATGYLKLQQHLIGAGQGLSYEATSRDMSQTNYSSARQGAIEDGMTYTEEKEILLNVMSEIYETFVISAWLIGIVKMPGFFEGSEKKRSYLAHEWISSPKRWVDPQKEANANRIALASGIRTFKQICAEQGIDWHAQIDDMAEVIEYAKTKNIDIGGVIYGKDADLSSEQYIDENENVGDDENT